MVTDKKSFRNYDDAVAFVEANANYRIGGTNRFLSPVPLEKLEHYSLIHDSPNAAITWGNESISRVRVFEYRP